MKKIVAEDLIRRSSVYILRFCIQRLVAVAMEEAVVIGPLQDLEGLVDLDNMSDLDLELLDALEVPKFDLIVKSVVEIHEHIGKYKNLYMVNEEECLADPKVFKFVEDFVDPFAYSDTDGFAPSNTAYAYLNILGVIHELICFSSEAAYDFDNDCAFYDFLDVYEELEGDYPLPLDAQTNVRIWHSLFLVVEQMSQDIQVFE